MEVDTFPKQNDSVSIEPCHDNDNYSQTIVTLKQLKISPITHNPKSLIACYLTKQKQYLTNRSLSYKAFWPDIVVIYDMILTLKKSA